MSVAELPAPTVNEAAFIRQAKQICQDLMVHRPTIYWTDFLISISLAWTALIVCVFAEPFSAIQIVALVVSGLMLYRSSVFTHELAHMPPSRFRLFRIVWNGLFGIPFLMPSFLYTDHRVHHTNQTYGTDGDGEYYPYANTSVRILILNYLITLIVPMFPVIRFGILAPISMLHPRFRKWVWTKASSLGTLNPAYVRAEADADERRAVRWQETGCMAVVGTLVTLLSTGLMSWKTMGIVYAAYLLALIVNNLRVYAGHRYIGSGEPMSFLNQMLDSTTIPGPWGVLWAPLGMRFHALHHLFPAMPYHAMGTAHRRLMRQLPADSPYHQTIVSSMTAALAMLLRNASHHSQTV